MYQKEANGVSGNLPDEIEQLNLLRFLYLEGAKDRQQYFERDLDVLRGTIPPQVATLTQLIILDLNFNKLEGKVRNEMKYVLKQTSLSKKLASHQFHL